MALYKDEPLEHSLTEPMRISPRVRLSLAERKVLLWLGDVFVTGVASVGALWLWTFTRPHPFTLDFLVEQAHWIPVLILSWTLVAWTLDLYNPQLAPQKSNVMRRLLGVATVILIGYLLIFFIIIAPRNMLPRRPLLYFLLLALVGSGLWRWAYAATLARGALRQRILIVGAGRSGTTLVATMQDKFAAEFEVLGFLDDGLAKQQVHIGDVPVLGETSDVLKIVHECKADAIVYAITHQLRPELFQALLDCRAAGLSVIQMPALYETLTGRVPVEHVRSEWLLPGEVTGGQAPLTYRLFTHLLDWSFGLIGGAFLLVVWPIVALLIKLDSPGPVFYRQVRLGRGGVPFELLKFRSMVADAEEENGAQWATDGDRRVTRMGRFLRRTRLDELPQIINILRGDIHLIGPRPERPEFIAQLEQELPFYRARLAVKPGLTGWAQVRYRYGNTVEDALIKLEYDLYYIKNRSALLDLSILLNTIGVILLFKGT
jgi:exopolysaccharide biosynthesis polyprenyl glycosylphosphotransferase